MTVAAKPDFEVDRPEMRISRARYARGCVAVRPLDSRDEFKGRVSHLACSLNMRFSGRECAYIASAAKARKLVALLDSGWRGNTWGDRFVPPQRDEYRDALRQGRKEDAAAIRNRVMADAKTIGIKPATVDLS